MKLGDIIDNFCKSHGFSYRQFAEISGLTSGYITMLVQNKNPKTGKPLKPTLETYKKIVIAMNMGLDELFDIMDDAPIDLTPDTTIAGDTLTLTERRLIAAYRAADERAREDALNTLLNHPAVKEKENRA